jgi:hypothetical protein
MESEGRGLRAGEVPTSGIEIGVFEVERSRWHQAGIVGYWGVDVIEVEDPNEVEDVDAW